MLLDAQLLFSDAQEITSGTINSTNIVKFGAGDVSYLPIVIQSVADFTGLTSLCVKIQTSLKADFSEPVDLVQATLSKEELKAGVKFPISYLPKGNLGYMQLVYIVDGSAESTGKITAGIVCADSIGFHEINL
ncbi:MAG: hypothetical protein IJ003_05990 [Candidatus Gastranaerophilales bacterium]|nr:hypothetical protein [Candidatus Gastranaerophilales bacterium]